MRKAPLTGVTSAKLDSCLIRNPPYTGAFVEVTSLSGGGGGGSSYDDTAVRGLISLNTSAIGTKQQSLTIQDSAGNQHTGVNAIVADAGTVSGSTLTLPTQAYSDTELRGLITTNASAAATNATALGTKHPSVTIQDSAGDHTGVTRIVTSTGQVSGTTLTLPAHNDSGVRALIAANTSAVGLKADASAVYPKAQT